MWILEKSLHLFVVGESLKFEFKRRNSYLLESSTHFHYKPSFESKRIIIGGCNFAAPHVTEHALRIKWILFNFP